MGGGPVGENDTHHLFQLNENSEHLRKRLGFAHRHDQVAVVGSDGTECDLL